MRVFAIHLLTLILLASMPSVGMAGTELKRGTPMTALESPDGALGCEAWAVNEGDEVVGFCELAEDAETKPTYWVGGSVVVLDGPVIVVETDGSITESPMIFGIAVGINNAGTIAGDIRTADGRFAAIWDDGEAAWQALPTPLGWTGASARGINAKGDVVGSVQNSTDLNTAVWERGEAFILPLVEDSLWCQGFAINNAGDVTGRCWTPDVEQHAAFWDKSGEVGYLTGGPDILFDASFGRAVNESGRIVGVDGDSAMSWNNGEATILADLGTANGVNNHGDIVGFIGANGEDIVATLWLAGSTDGIELGTLGGTVSLARAINNRGVVVGLSQDNEGTVHAFIARP